MRQPPPWTLCIFKGGTRCVSKTVVLETTVPIGPWLLKPYLHTELARKLKALFTPPCIEDDAQLGEP